MEGGKDPRGTDDVVVWVDVATLDMGGVVVETIVADDVRVEAIGGSEVGIGISRHVFLFSVSNFELGQVQINSRIWYSKVQKSEHPPLDTVQKLYRPIIHRYRYKEIILISLFVTVTKSRVFCHFVTWLTVEHRGVRAKPITPYLIPAADEPLDLAILFDLISACPANPKFGYNTALSAERNNKKNSSSSFSQVFVSILRQPGAGLD